MEKLSRNFTYAEATNSATAKRSGIENKPSETELKNMILFCEKILEPLREGIGNQQISIKSFFRSGLLNRLVGGANNSQHTEGKAADITTTKGNVILFNYIKDNLEFDQLIWEFGDNNNPDWVHVSYNEGKNRKMILRAMKVGGRTIYKNIG